MSPVAVARWEPFYRRPTVHVGTLIMVAIAMFVPYGLAGPALFRDDWLTIRNAELDRWWMAAGSSQWKARPVGSAIYAVTFGLIGERPLLHYVLSAAVVTATAVAIYVVAGRFLPTGAAFAVAITWLLLPNHTSLEMWPSTLNIAVSLLLFVLGIERLAHPEPTAGKDWTAAGLLGIGLLAYEAMGPAAVVAVIAVRLRRSAGKRLSAVLPPLLALGVAGLWMLANWHPEKKGLETTMDPWFLIPGHFGFSITGDLLLAQSVVPGVVLLTSAVALYDLIVAERRTCARWPQWTVAAGWALLVLGALPFVRYFYAPIGFGDRVTVVSGVGGALVLVAVTAQLARWWRPVALLFGAVVAVAATSQRASMVATYATAADDSRRILDAINDRWPTPPDHPMVFGPEVVDRHVRAFEPMEFPVQVLYGTRDVRVTDAFELGEFEQAPEAQRFDLRTYSRLDDGRLGPPEDGPDGDHP